MKLQSSWAWTKIGKDGPRQYSIPQAIDEACYSSAESLKARTKDQADKNTELLGRLLERLRDKNLLDDADVVEILGVGWEIAPDV